MTRDQRQMESPMDKNPRLPANKREHEIRIEKDGKRYFVRCFITNENDRVAEECVAYDENDLMETVIRMHKMFSNPVGFNPNMVELSLNKNDRERGHLTRDQRQTMRVNTPQDIVKEDQFELDINVEEIERVEKEERAKIDEVSKVRTDEQIPF